MIDKSGFPKKWVQAIYYYILHENTTPTDILEGLVSKYDSKQCTLTYKQAPQCTTIFTKRLMFPWYNMDVKNGTK